LDGQPLMAMFRRSPRSSPPLRRRQEDIARQEAELREKLEKLERMVTKRPVIAQNRSSAQGAEQGVKRNKTDKRLHVSVALQGKHSLDEGRSARRPRSLRKERREGRIIFLLLVTALAAAVIWLITHLHS
jgi:hypothetical protein